MKRIPTDLFIGLLSLFMALPATGQDLEETLGDLLATNAQLYLEPVVTAFGTGVNSGIFRRAKPHKLLGFDITLNVSLTALPEAAKTFEFYIDPATEVPFTVALSGQPTVDVTLNLDALYDTSRTSSTFFGDTQSHEIAVNEDYAVDQVGSQLVAAGIPQAAVNAAEATIRNLVRTNVPAISTPPGFADLPAFPMLMPQISIGLPLGLEVMVRGFPNVELPEGAGTFSFFGYGGKIGINRFIPTIPLVFPALSFGYYATNLNVADILKANNSILTFQISKSVPFITAYGGLGLEKSNMEVSYTFTEGPVTEEIDFELDGKNKTRLMAGIRLKLALLSINADYNKGEYDAYNIGVGITFR